MNEVDSSKYTDFKFFINTSDVLFTLTLNNLVKDKVNNIIGKIIIIRENQEVNLFEVAKLLDLMNINKLNIIAIYPLDTLEKINFVNINEPSVIKYLEVNADDFISYLNNPSYNFLDYNKYTLYIIKEGSYLDIKNIFIKINDFDVNIGRGSSQKAHVVSPLDFRVSCYLMALFKFDYKYISYLNTFNVISKDRYLPFFEKFQIKD